MRARRWVFFGGEAVDTTGLIFKDTFTEASDTTLASHTPDIGQSWTLLIQTGGTSTLAVNGANDNLESENLGAGVAAFYTADVSGGYNNDDMSIEAFQVNGDTIDDVIVLGVRVQDSANMYAVRFNETTSVLYEKVSSSWSAITSDGGGIANGETVRLSIKGSTLCFYDEDILQISASTPSITGGGSAGVGYGAIILPGDDMQSQTIDNLNVYAGTFQEPYFIDKFTDSAGTSLSVHTPDVGSGWTNVITSGVSADLAVNAFNACAAASTVTNGASLYIATVDGGLPSADYIVECLQINGDTGDDYNYMVARYQDTQNFYALRWTESGGQMYDVNGGTWNTVGSSVGSGVFTDDSRIGFEVNGTTLKVYVDGSEVVSGTASSISDVGNGGYGMGNLQDNGGDMSSQQIDKFKIKPIQ